MNHPFNRTDLVSFHGDPKIKSKYLSRVRAHYKADEIIHGKYWENGKGCAVGCTIEGDEHSRYETELGLPTWLAYLEDGIFEGLPNGESKKFPVKFLEAIPVGVNYSGMMHEFYYWLLMDKKEGSINRVDASKFPDIVKQIKLVADLHLKASKGKVPWSAAESATRSAAWSAARSAAESAARSAAWSAAESAARSAQSKKLLYLLKHAGKKIKVERKP